MHSVYVKRAMRVSSLCALVALATLLVTSTTLSASLWAPHTQKVDVLEVSFWHGDASNPNVNEEVKGKPRTKRGAPYEGRGKDNAATSSFPPTAATAAAAAAGAGKNKTTTFSAPEYMRECHMGWCDMRREYCDPVLWTCQPCAPECGNPNRLTVETEFQRCLRLCHRFMVTRNPAQGIRRVKEAKKTATNIGDISSHGDYNGHEEDVKEKLTASNAINYILAAICGATLTFMVIVMIWKRQEMALCLETKRMRFPSKEYGKVVQCCYNGNQGEK